MKLTTQDATRGALAAAGDRFVRLGDVIDYAAALLMADRDDPVVVAHHEDRDFEVRLAHERDEEADTRPEWVRRAQAGILPVKDYTSDAHDDRHGNGAA